MDFFSPSLSRAHVDASNNFIHGDEVRFNSGLYVVGRELLRHTYFFVSFCWLFVTVSEYRAHFETLCERERGLYYT